MTGHTTKPTTHSPTTAIYDSYLPPATAPTQPPSYLQPSSGRKPTTPTNQGIYFQEIDSLVDVRNFGNIEGSLEPELSPEESSPNIILTPSLPGPAWYSL